jgi:glycosyltransferase involved in cell wall biosynthesis
MHTDYNFYFNQIYFKFLNIDASSYLFKTLNYFIQIKIFNGIIVTGEKLKKDFLNYTDNVFNANEINLDQFQFTKYDEYNYKYEEINFIYCGRIAKEKNIDELINIVIDYKYDFKLHIIGDGPQLLELKKLINNLKNIDKDKILFINSLSHKELFEYYKKLNNRIFIFTSLSETFGKTPMEAGACGIPIFIKESNITNYLYKDKINCYIFKNKNQFLEKLDYFLKKSSKKKKY